MSTQVAVFIYGAAISALALEWCDDVAVEAGVLVGGHSHPLFKDGGGGC